MMAHGNKQHNLTCVVFCYVTNLNMVNNETGPWQAILIHGQHGQQ